MMSIYSGVCQRYNPRYSVHIRHPWISVYPPSVLADVFGGRDRACLEMLWEIEIEGTPRSLGGWDRASMELHLETKRSSELRDMPRGRD